MRKAQSLCGFEGGSLVQESGETRKENLSKSHRVGCQRTNLVSQRELMFFQPPNSLLTVNMTVWRFS
jgi:hypothetical protein